MRLDYLTRAFASAARGCLASSERRLASVGGKLDALSPLKVLARGYAIPHARNRVIASVNDVAPGDALRLQVGDGRIGCIVESVEKISD